MEVGIFWNILWTVELLVDSCIFPAWWVGYIMNSGFTQKSPPFPGIHSGQQSVSLRQTRERDESSLSPSVSEHSGLANCLFEHKVPVKFILTKV